MKTEDTQEVICKILENLLEQFHGSRAYIVEYDWEKQRQNCTFEVNVQGVIPQQERLHDLPTHNTPWWTEEMLLRHPILLFNLDELPAEAQLEKAFLASRKIRSLMVIPMIAQEQV